MIDGWTTLIAAPAKTGAETVPAGVSVCAWPESAEPVKVGADTLPAGVPALALAFVPVAVVEC